MRFRLATRSMTLDDLFMFVFFLYVVTVLHQVADLLRRTLNLRADISC